MCVCVCVCVARDGVRGRGAGDRGERECGSAMRDLLFLPVLHNGIFKL